MNNPIVTQTPPALQVLEELHHQKNLLEVEKEMLRKSIIPAEIQIKLNELDEEFEDKEKAIDQRIAEVEKEVRTLAATEQASYKGNILHIIFGKRVSWDTKKLDGLALVIKEIATCRTETPTVTIRAIGGK